MYINKIFKLEMFPEMEIKLVINVVRKDNDWQTIRFIDNKPLMKIYMPEILMPI